MEHEKLSDDQKVMMLRQFLYDTIQTLKNSNPEKPAEMKNDMITGQFIATLQLKLKYTRVFEDMMRFINDEPPLPPATEEEFIKEINSY